MRWIIPLLAFLVILPAYAQDISGVAHIFDGDSLIVDGTHIELWGLDAPEPEQDCSIASNIWRCGEAATQHLKRFIGTNEVSCKRRGHNDDGKIIAKCAVGSLDLGAEMVEAGLAIPYWPISEKYYLRSYKEARGLDRGMHKGTFVEPWEWRKKNKM